LVVVVAVVVVVGGVATSRRKGQETFQCFIVIPEKVVLHVTAKT
jgi:hypothetical protein